MSAMDSFSSDRTHRPGAIASRHSSSSSMKFSSKPSILSPARARDPSISLSTSRSRRLRPSGSIKNGQASPMFPAAGGRKRGGGFENPEPSSPKVTCIGQVRVKTKKKGKKIQTLTRRRSAEVSFRRTDHARHDQFQRQSSVNSQYQQHQEFSSHRNQRWVHLPLTICETLRGFGSEFSCLFPCKPSCFSESSEREKGEEKVGGEGNEGVQSPCGALLGRCLVAVQDDGEGGKGRDIEAVVGGGDEEEGERPIRSARRHVFGEIEIKDDIFEVKDREGNDMEGREGRVSICIPPKNALLLMRCRSDPAKMEALANRCWEPQLPKQEEEEEEEEEERESDENNCNRNKKETRVEMVEVKDEVEMVQKENLELVSEEGRDSVSVDINEEQEEENQPEAEVSLEMEVQDNKEDKLIEDLRNIEALQDGEEEKQEETEKETLVEDDENELGFTTLLEALADEESEEDDESDPIEDKNEDESRVSYSNASFSLQSDQEISEPEEVEEEEEELAEEVALELEYSMESTVEKETQDKTLEVKLVEKVTQEGGTRETERIAVVERESEAELKKKEERESSARLPDSLLLMMCEPKLSMEVSKETWVCSTDFIRWKPPVQVKQTDGGDDHVDDDEPTKKRVSVDSNFVKSYHQLLLQPPRSSCCLPAKSAAVSMATTIEQKLVSAVAYEPFVLTRCKSAPMRTASKKVAPDACFWKNRTLEPHRRATFGIGAAEVGF